jgi:hypothetical protein
MNAPPGENGRTPRKPAKQQTPEVPFPKALWAAMNRDPEAVNALVWALDRLLGRKRKPPLCYPGGCDCTVCHPELTTNR